MTGELWQCRKLDGEQPVTGERGWAAAREWA